MNQYRLQGGEIVESGRAFRMAINGEMVSFPPDWLDKASESELAGYGIAMIPKPEAVVGIGASRLSKIMEIEAAAANALAPVTGGYSQEERDTWSVQESEANAWLADQGAQTPMLSAMAEARGITLDELVKSVAEKSKVFKVLAGKVFGKRSVLLAEIEAANTPEDVAKIAW